MPESNRGQLGCQAVRFRSLATLGVLVSALTAMALPAGACSISGPTPLRSGLELGLLDREGGIYEQLAISGIPSILIREATTVSVVTRYWGRPPANVGPQYEGGEWFSWVKNPFVGDSCGGKLDDEGNILTPDGRPGTLGYGFAPPPEDTGGPLSPAEAAAQGAVPWHRSAPSLTLDNGSSTGPLSAAELEMLEFTFGPGNEVEIPTSTYFRSTIIVWYPTVLGIALIAAVVAVIGFLVHRRTSQQNSTQV